MSIKPLVPLLPVHSSELFTKPFTPTKWTRHASNPTLMLWSLKCRGEDNILPNPDKEPSLPWATSVFTLSATPTTAGLLNVMPPLPSLVLWKDGDFRKKLDFFSNLDYLRQRNTCYNIWLQIKGEIWIVLHSNGIGPHSHLRHGTDNPHRLCCYSKILHR
jgi:hypothetical protein